VLESEWSPYLDIVIPYGITVKTRFGTTPHKFETIASYSYNPQKTKNPKENKSPKSKLVNSMLADASCDAMTVLTQIESDVYNGEELPHIFLILMLS